MSRSILVTGATGRQGGSLIKTLLASPNASTIKIFALTRTPQSTAAKKLKEQGVTIIPGDLNNVPAVFKNAELTKQPLWGVFSLQNPGIKPSATIIERRQGKALIDHAISHNVEFFIYASVDRGGDESEGTPTPVAQFSSKNDIEQYLFSKAGNMKWVILRPTTFMEGLLPDNQGKTWAATYKYVLKSKPMHLISTSDIGRVAATVFLNPEKYANRAITLVGDKLTFDEANAIFKEKTGVDIPIFPILGWKLVMKMMGLGQLKIMFKWFPENPKGVDVEKCREEWELMTWGEWIEKESAWKKVQ